MKNLLFLGIFCLFALAAQAQKDVTRFLGIPVDGTKSEMIRQLKAKGFTTNPYNSDVLTGEFNGRDVFVFVGTNNNKVWRVMVTDTKPTDERDIQIRFNNLCRQFENNDKYVSLKSDRIPDNEKISFEIMVHKKRYEAIFCQKSTSNLEPDLNKSVWFMITELSYGQYSITMYYDNEYNHADGEDL